MEERKDELRRVRERAQGRKERAKGTEGERGTKRGTSHGGVGKGDERCGEKDE